MTTLESVEFFEMCFFMIIHDESVVFVSCTARYRKLRSWIRGQFQQFFVNEFSRIYGFIWGFYFIIIHGTSGVFVNCTARVPQGYFQLIESLSWILIESWWMIDVRRTVCSIYLDVNKIPTIFWINWLCTASFNRVYFYESINFCCQWLL